MSNQHPVIFVHGILGFGPKELCPLRYWGTALKVLSPLKCHEASVGPLSSAHDRACELAAQIKGVQVDYGVDHAQAAGHNQYGDNFASKGFVPEWSEAHPVHLVGHSLGSPTIRCLQHLLELDYWGWGSNHRWISSITTISGVSNGSTLTYFFGADEKTGRLKKSSGIAPLLLIIETFAAASGGVMDAIYDFDLDHWGFKRETGEALIHYLGRVAKSKFLWGTDNAGYTLSLQGAYADNQVWQTYPDTYYFSHITEQTHPGWLTGQQYPELTMNPALLALATYIGQKTFTRPPIPVPAFNSADWWENDGAVSTYSQKYPHISGLHPVGGEFDEQTPLTHFQPGRWYYQWEHDVDHLDICISPQLDQIGWQQRFYTTLLYRLAALEIPQPKAATEALFASPIFEGFTVELADPAESQQQALLTLLNQATGVANLPRTPGWTINPVHASVPHQFDLVPPIGKPIAIKQAWELCYLLREQRNVTRAEPAFEILQDNLPTTNELKLAPSALRWAIEREAQAAAEKAAPRAAVRAAGAPVIVYEGEPDWSPRSVQAPDAWQLAPRSPETRFPAGGKRRGAGILVGHPDSGYRKHPELWENDPAYPNRVRVDLDRDFIDDDWDAESEVGDHGLGTSSVLISRDNQTLDGQCITGVAPEAELVPLRVTKPRLLIPAPVLLSGGVQCLRKAIYYAISDEVRCHVLSISLGWFGNESLHDAIKAAIRQNVIVCAAAGNYVGFVVWPASYPEVISVAGSTWDRQIWAGSCCGQRVDVTAPAQNVWVARMDPQQGAGIVQSSGTSFAVATTAGIAALWLAHHGRDYLIDRYQGEFPLASVFKQVLMAACDPPPQGHNGLFGVGIVNAQKTLAARLPTLEEMRASAQPAMPALAALSAVEVASTTVRTSAVFASVPAPAVRAGLSALLRTPEPEIDERMQGLEDELIFHILTTPRLREQFIRLGEASAEPGALIRGALMTDASHADQVADLPKGLVALEGVSRRLRAKII